MTPDPIGLEGGINLYAYAVGDPVNKIDPMGLLSDYGMDDFIYAIFETGEDSYDYQKYEYELKEDIKQFIEDTATEVAEGLVCTATCGLKVVIKSTADDIAIRQAIRIAAETVAKEAIKNLMPVYNVASNANTAFGAAKCVYTCVCTR